MSGIFGGGAAKREAKKQSKRAREDRQMANEDAGRAQQQAERGAGGGRGRDMLIGNLSQRLKQSLGG